MAANPASALVDDKDPPAMVFMPQHDKATSRILCLANPRTDELNKYLFTPDVGVFEFKKITPPSDSRRSVLTIYDSQSSEDAPQALATDAEPAKNTPVSTDGYINKAAFALVATPIDPIWLVLPILSPASANTKAESSKRLFQPIDDLFEDIPDSSSDLRYLLSHEPFRKMVATRMDTVCDTVDADGEKMYRLSEERLIKKVVAISEGFAGTAFPSSMEAHFVGRALETPVLAVKREETATVQRDPQESESAVESQISISTITTAIDMDDSQSAMESPSFSSAMTTISTPATELSSFTTATSTDSLPQGPPSEIIRLQRIRTALSFILSSYIPPRLSNSINTCLSSPASPIDFTPLHKHLKQVAALKAEALASRSMGDFSRKRTLDDGEGAESRAEKKQRLEEEEKKRKMGESRGVRDLKKVNTTGMKKMSDFFAKSVPNAKTKA